jgi:hypothetical protein
MVRSRMRACGNVWDRWVPSRTNRRGKVNTWLRQTATPLYFANVAKVALAYMYALNLDNARAVSGDADTRDDWGSEPAPLPLVFHLCFCL